MSLTGQLLISMPQMDDPFFARSVIYLLSHSEAAGAMGLIVNKALDALTVTDLCEQLKIQPLLKPIPEPVYFGGPVAPGHGFVLHSVDYREEGTQAIDEQFALTASFDILHSIAVGDGPSSFLVAVGYAGWGAGQLEAEILRNGWLSVPADPGLVFNTDDTAKWRFALTKLGVSPDRISADVGRA